MIENQPFTQLSDHYGLSLMLAYRHGPEEKEGYDGSEMKFANNLDFSHIVDGGGENRDSIIINISKDEI